MLISDMYIDTYVQLLHKRLILTKIVSSLNINSSAHVCCIYIYIYIYIHFT